MTPIDKPEDSEADEQETSIWTWWREGGKFHIEKTATIPPEPASKDQLPPLLQRCALRTILFANTASWASWWRLERSASGMVARRTGEKMLHHSPLAR
jgi:hypothetical protein